MKPTKELKEIIKHIPRGFALDIGAGEGKNSIFLAKQGFNVESIDKDENCLNKFRKFVNEYKLSIKIKSIDVKKFKFKRNKYSLILGVTSLDFLRFSEIKKIISKIKESLVKNGVFYLVVFSKKDPSFGKIKKMGIRMIEDNTFYFSKIKTARHYFTKNELLNLLDSFQIIKIKEESKKKLNKNKFDHNVIRIIAKK